MEVRGKIIAVQPVQTGEGKNGAWKKQDYVIEYEQTSQYPRKMMFNLWGDKIDQYNIREGQSVKVSFDIDCREYNGRWYNDIRAWKVDPDEDLPADDGFVPPIDRLPVNQPPVMTGISPSDDNTDLPF
ncbi:MAG: DUF3127 domain-containing protein [Tannerella sp.]|jgi:hypothetical protein|nr:DUF3127 domain-containing protein [Tannerella sp.]